MQTAQKNWPLAALQAFTMRMAGHGFPVSATLMTYDRPYAIEQLQLAHTLADETLRGMSMELFASIEKIGGLKDRRLHLQSAVTH